MFRGSSNSSIYELSSYSYHSSGNPLMIFHNDSSSSSFVNESKTAMVSLAASKNILGALYFDQSLLFSYDYSSLFSLSLFSNSLSFISYFGFGPYVKFSFSFIHFSPLINPFISNSCLILSSINDFISIFDSKPIIISSYLISVDHFLILPLYESLKSYITSIDVIHS
jgi:hypothetical protein